PLPLTSLRICPLSTTFIRSSSRAVLAALAPRATIVSASDTAKWPPTRRATVYRPVVKGHPFGRLWLWIRSAFEPHQSTKRQDRKEAAHVNGLDEERGRSESRTVKGQSF